MKVTPLDIKKQEFSRAMRGYDADEVRAFLQMVATQVEQVIEDQHRQNNRFEELQGKLRHYERVEEALQATLETARQNADVAQQTAESKAALIIEEARGKADTILREGQNKIQNAEDEAAQIIRQADGDQRSLKTEIKALVSRRDELLARLRGFLSSELELLERFQEREPAPPPEIEPPRPGVVGRLSLVGAASASDELEAEEDEAGNGPEGEEDVETKLATHDAEPAPQAEAARHLQDSDEVSSEQDEEEMRKIRQILDDLD